MVNQGQGVVAFVVELDLVCVVSVVCDVSPRSMYWGDCAVLHLTVLQECHVL